MQERLPDFVLYPGAYRDGRFKRSDLPCCVCAKARGWIFDGAVYGPFEERPSICPWCIADGTAADRISARFNDVTEYAQRTRASQVPTDERSLVEGRTPGFLTWQGNHWLTCCGKACIFLSEAAEGELRGRYAGAIPSILAENQGWSDEENQQLLDSIGNGITAAYVFKCQVCGELLGYWDCD